MAKQRATRPSLSAGIAALGAGAIALSAIAPLPGHAAPAPEPSVRALAVDLAAVIDPITPWVTTIKTSLQNLGALPVLYLQQPFPILTTMVRNQLTYLKELPDIGLIASQMWGNVKTFLTAPWQAAPELISDSLVTSIAGFPISQQTVYGFLLEDAPDQLDPLIQFTASPVSGILLGALGPVVSPLIQVGQSLAAARTFLKSGNLLQALNELINIPAKATNAFLNGGKYLDLTKLAPKLGITLPPQVTTIGFNMGGLLNVSPRAYEPPTIPGSDLHPYGGGVAFDAVAAQLEQPTLGLRNQDGSTATVIDPGWPVGTLGPVIGMGQAIADEMLVSNQLAISGAATAPAATTAAAAVADRAAPARTRGRAGADAKPGSHRAAKPAASRGATGR